MQRRPHSGFDMMVAMSGAVSHRPQKHSHSWVPSERCSGFHNRTRNSFTPLPGSRGCLPRSCPAHLCLQLPALGAQGVHVRLATPARYQRRTREKACRRGRVSGQQPCTILPPNTARQGIEQIPHCPHTSTRKCKALGCSTIMR